MKVIKVNLSSRTYPIWVGKNLTAKLTSFLKKLKKKKVFILCDEALVDQRSVLLKALTQHFETIEIPLTAGEALKEIESVYPIYGKLLENKADRHSVIIALGGGTLGDVAGFIAGTFMRGIDWIGLPTTLLAQVDSSVGGKTGINHASGKNLIGVFHQPKLVIADTHALKTLGQREIVSGLGETIKYAITFDKKFFQFLDQKLELLLKLDSVSWEKAIAASLEWKAKKVSQDEFDLKGIRETLNFGHTFGHALESVTHYHYFQHGEAVILGMRFALALSWVRKKLSQKDYQRMNELLLRLPVPSVPETIQQNELLEAMKKDKKSKNGKIRFVLVDRVGHSILDSGVKEKDLHKAFRLVFPEREN